MRRGTRIAQAYVSVSADGDGINEEIVHSVDEAGPGIEKAGDEHGKRYGDHFSEGFVSRMRERLRNRGEDGALGLPGNAGESEGSSVGDRMGSAMVRSLQERLAGADKVVEEMSARLDKALGGRTSTAKLDVMAHSLRTAENAAARLERQLRTTMKAEGLLGSAVSGNGRGGRRDTGLTSIDDWLSGTRFRNNALNILAKSMGGVIHGFELGGLAVMRFVKNVKSAEEGASVFGKIAAGFGSSGGEGAGMLAKGLSAVAASGPGAAVALAAIIFGASTLVTVLSGLLAIVVALSATIASALVGALAVGTAGLAAFGAAAGLVVLAFMSMTDAQKKMLTEAFKPVHEEAIGLGQTMLHDMVPAFATWSKHLQVALALVQPLAAVMGGAFARAGNIITAALSGPGIQMFLAMLTKTLPSITTNLSRAFGSFLNGLGGMFAALLPYVAKFAIYLADVADRFARWATSAKGQNAISDFVDRALTALHSLWSFLGAVGGLISKLLFDTQGQTAGNTIFDNMTRGIQNFTAYLTPDRLQTFFNEGVRLAHGLGDAIHAIGVTMAALNDAGVISVLSSMASAAAVVANTFRSLPGPIRKSLNPILSIEAAAKGMAAAVVGALSLVLDAIGEMIGGLARALGIISKIPKIGGAFKSAAAGAQAASDNVLGLANRLAKLPARIMLSIGADTTPAAAAVNRLVSQISAYHINVPVTASTNAAVAEGAALSAGHPSAPRPVSGNISSLIGMGAGALAGTSVGSGGYKPKKVKKYHNPYVAFANRLIKEGPSVAAQIRNAILTVNKQVANAITEASGANSADSVQSSLTTLSESITTAATETVNTAQSALNSAAQSLASATSKSAAKAALRKVRAAQRDLRAALADQQRIQNAANILNAQKVVTEGNVQALVAGAKINATLADFAEARSRVAELMQDANQKLNEALQLRDQYKSQISDSIRSFGSLLSAQAQTIDGVEQALSSNDIVSNLQTKLGQIKRFQDDLRLLLAQGLSNDAYKQIVDAGVEQGTTFAEGLLSGGNAAIQNTNSLVSQINGIADSLGSETSSRLYQAGVDAAQGLVDGLTSLSAQLDAAAYALGTSIANAVRTALGIHSPSTVLRGMMTYVGDGIALGLGDQGQKVGTASAALAARVAINPSGTYSATHSGSGGVSGNQKVGDVSLTVITPTEDPKAVAHEAINELVGRL